MPKLWCNILFFFFTDTNIIIIGKIKCSQVEKMLPFPLNRKEVGSMQ